MSRDDSTAAFLKSLPLKSEGEIILARHEEEGAAARPVSEKKNEEMQNTRMAALHNALRE